jgi:Uma2 family endonuclease
MVSKHPAKVYYPDSDGQPMADNTKQFRWIVTIKENLDLLFVADPNVFVAGDLLWYPVEGDNTIRNAPDAMVVFGRPKGDSPEATLCERGSYQQWKEDNIPPQVVFEILSPGNRMGEMERKRQFYERYGVAEYYIYDPDRLDFSGWMRSGDRLLQIEAIDDWVSPQLGIRFVMNEGAELIIYRPDGDKFIGFGELDELRRSQQQRADNAEHEVFSANQRAENAEREAERLAAKLRELGIEP